MAWVKVPKENFPVFHSCLPRDPRVSTLNMFGGVAALVNGHMVAGLFGLGAIVKLSPDDQRAALEIDGAAMFDPMGNGRIMRDTVFLPDAVLEEPAELRDWIRKAVAYAATLPAKGKGAAAKGAPAKTKTKTKATSRSKTAAAGKTRSGKAPAKVRPMK